MSRTKLPKGGYCLEFSNSLFEVKNVDIASSRPSYAILIITFKLDKYPTGTEYIVTTSINERAISLHGSNVQIWGTSSGEPLEFKYDEKEWNTIFIQWTNIGDNTGHVYYRSEHKTFSTRATKRGVRSTYIGALKNKSASFNGCIAALDLYEARSPPEEVFPEEIRNVLIEAHEDLVSEVKEKSVSST